MMSTPPAVRPPINDSFGLLPQPSGRFGSFTVSLTANLLLGALFLWVAISQLHRQPPVPRYESTELVFPAEASPPPKLPAPPQVKTFAPPPPIAQTPPKISAPKPQPELPKPEIVKMNAPAMPNLPPAQPKAVVAPPQPKTGVFASSKPTAVANNQTAPSVKTGGFGDPSGVAPNPNASKPATVAAYGSFAAAPGSDQGAGAARKGAVQGTSFGSGVANGVPGGTSRGAVASAGFSNGVVGGMPGGSPHGPVANTGFGNNAFGGSGAQVVKTQAVNFVPPVVISEPRPQYTEEARQLKIQGEVTLQVKFGADGKVEVLGLVSRLGHGLDEQAERVAQQIHFKPAMRNGQPTDHVTYIHILFQLA